MKKFIRILVPVLLAVAIVASLWWYLFVFDRDFTRDMLLQQARFHDLHGNSKMSSWFYNMAYDHSGRDENVAIELANQYKSDGNYTKAEVTLSNAIHNGGTVELYTALCKTYVEQDKLLDAVAMLENIQNPEMKQQLSALRPTAPEPSQEPGYYTQYIDLELIAPHGTIYYTTTGEYPSIAGEAYAEPITLPAGETLIYAITVDDNGLVSPATILGYTITGVIEPVTFTDDTLEDAIRAALNTDEADILYTNELWEITEFTVPEGVVDFSDLALMPYLKTLTIQGQDLISLEPLSGLLQLETLSLADCSFPAEELSYLAKLPQLKELNLQGCGLSTIEGLTGAVTLEKLNLKSNTVRNLEAISTMTGLKDLNLQHNALVGLESLSTLVNLEILDISYNSVTSLAPLSSCTRLSALNADSNQLETVYGIQNLPLLTVLSLDYNQLPDVSQLSSCTELVNLSFSNNQVADISGLSSLLKLDILDFSYNNISSLPAWQEGCTLRVIDGSYNQLPSIDSLAQLEKIGYIYMDYNQLTSITALANCFHLVQINVFGNDIDQVAELTDHNIIVNYDPT